MLEEEPHKIEVIIKDMQEDLRKKGVEIDMLFSEILKLKGGKNE